VITLNQFRKVFKWIINLLWGLMIAGLCFLLIQTFILTSFKIPSDSMAPVLEGGDNVLVNKLIPGARLFNIFDSLKGEQVGIYRLPGSRKIKHNDIVVFNFLHPYTWDKVEMHIMKYYIKRCVGLPGDSITIRNGFFNLNGETNKVGNIDSQQRIARTEKDEFGDSVFNTFPFDSIISWNIQDFGPFYIPRQGDRVEMNRTNYLLYHKLIIWELQEEINYRNDCVYQGKNLIESYTFQKNYYFMAGDKGEDSLDSRYWGLLPEEYIVGKACLIWRSIDPYTGKNRWDRTFRKL